MSDEDETTLNTKGLDQLIALFGHEMPTTRVGILGSDAVRNQTKGQANNAEIGAYHEFGTASLPQRSFLRVPLADHLDKKLEASGAFDEDLLKETMAQLTFVPYMRKVGALAVGVVLEGFNTQGYGKWKPSNMDAKSVKQTLVETGQLMKSITYDIKEGA